MSGTQARPALAGYRDTVVELMEEGTPFGDVEDAINSQPGLTEEQKSALWLFAFSLHDRSEQQSDPRPHLTAVQVAEGDSEMTEQAQGPTLGDAGRAAVSEQPGAERDQRYVGSARATSHARPLEFDDKGFPVPQDHRSFRERVARLLNPH